MSSESQPAVVILGIFAADLAFRAARMPVIGETLIGSDFGIGCGGKGSNQAVAARRSGATTAFLTRIGRDVFGGMALDLWRGEGIDITGVAVTDEPTGAAFIYVDEASGQNAIIVNPGAARGIDGRFLSDVRARIAGARIFAIQLEQPVETAAEALAIARAGGAMTVFNPAPAPESGLPDTIWPLCDIVVPNEVEATMLTGIAVVDPASAAEAGSILLAKGAGSVIVTLGGQGALLCSENGTLLIPAFRAGAVVDTTGAGDAFMGGLCAALAEGRTLADAARFAGAVAGLSVTRPGTAASMPGREEVDALLAGRTGGAVAIPA